MIDTLDITAPTTAPWHDLFQAYLARRELRIPRCRRTGRVLDFLELGQVNLEARELEWIDASGRARLFSFVVYRRQYHPDFVPPYNVAAITLEEGPLLISTVMAEPENIAVDMPLEATFDLNGRLVFVPTGTPEEGR